MTNKELIQKLKENAEHTYRTESFSNGDRVRLMMDDELADFMILSPEMEFDICCLCKYGNPTPTDDRGQCLALYACDSNARAEAFKKWLKQPIERG